MTGLKMKSNEGSCYENYDLSNLDFLSWRPRSDSVETEETSETNFGLFEPFKPENNGNNRRESLELQHGYFLNQHSRRIQGHQTQTTKESREMELWELNTNVDEQLVEVVPAPTSGMNQNSLNTCLQHNSREEVQDPLDIFMEPSCSNNIYTSCSSQLPPSSNCSSPMTQETPSMKKFIEHNNTSVKQEMERKGINGNQLNISQPAFSVCSEVSAGRSTVSTLKHEHIESTDSKDDQSKTTNSKKRRLSTKGEPDGSSPEKKKKKRAYFRKCKYPKEVVEQFVAKKKEEKRERNRILAAESRRRQKQEMNTLRDENQQLKTNLSQAHQQISLLKMKLAEATHSSAFYSTPHPSDEIQYYSQRCL